MAAPTTTQQFSDGRYLDRRTTRIRARFQPNGSSAIDNTKNVGRGIEVTYNSTGSYTVRFLFPAKNLIGARADLWLSAHTDLKIQVVGAPSQASDGTWSVTFNVIAVNTLTDIAANAANWVDVEAVLQNVGQN